jgi:hypothetical protein
VASRRVFSHIAHSTGLGLRRVADGPLRVAGPRPSRLRADPVAVILNVAERRRVSLGLRVAGIRHRVTAPRRFAVGLISALPRVRVDGDFTSPRAFRFGVAAVAV